MLNKCIVFASNCNFTYEVYKSQECFFCHDKKQSFGTTGIDFWGQIKTTKWLLRVFLNNEYLVLLRPVSLN